MPAVLVAAAWSLGWWPGGGGGASAAGEEGGVVIAVDPTTAAWDEAPVDTVAIPSLGVDTVLAEYTAAEAAQGYDEVAGTPCLVSGVIVCIDPVSTTEVVWQRGGSHGIGFGAAPAADAEQNVYLFGHADDAGEAVFSRLRDLAPGDEIRVGTGGGELTYVVDRVLTVGKDDYTSLPEAVEQVPGRLLLVSCDHTATAPQGGAGWALDNVVVLAHLAGARP